MGREPCVPPGPVLAAKLMKPLCCASSGLSIDAVSEIRCVMAPAWTSHVEILDLEWCAQQPLEIPTLRAKNNVIPSWHDHVRLIYQNGAGMCDRSGRSEECLEKKSTITE